MPIFIPFSVTIKEMMLINILGDSRLQVMPGRLHGRITMIPSSIRSMGGQSDLELVKIVCNYADDQDNAYGHLAFAYPTIFLPPLDANCRRCGTSMFMGTTVEVRSSIDPRGLIHAQLDDGTNFNPLPDHDRFMVIGGGLDESSALYVKLITHNGSSKQALYATDGAAIEYRLPIQQLLWRRAAKKTETDFIPEGEGHIFFKCMGRGQMSDYPIPPSPIRVIPPPSDGVTT